MSVVLFLVTAILATGCALSVTARFPWSESARAAGVPMAVAAGFAPLLAGLATVVVLWALPGAGHVIRASAVLFLLAVGSVPAACAGFVNVARPSHAAATRRTRVVWALGILLAGFACALIVDAITTPLVHNDALEYATVGRILYDSGDLRVYPVVNPQVSPTGMFAPWTHPPLYVALACLGYDFEGSSTDTTLFRLIAPWCLLAATYCVAAMGRRISLQTGLLAALLFVSTPMLYLGGTSAQIDALPVVGFTVAFAVFTSLDGGAVRRGAAAGLALGLSMWTHSQAILFPLLLLPLLLFCESGQVSLRSHLIAASKAAAVCGLVALVVAAAPYVRNVTLFGALVSDNPVVFAYAPLAWQDFFKLQRGLAHAQEIVQYGILKGFFAIEIFSVGFWLALLGVPTAMAASVIALRRTAYPAERNAAVTLAPAALLVTMLYFAGTILSVLLHTDVMIRNERYMLVLMPCVALLGALALEPAGRQLKGVASFLRGALLATLIVMLLVQLVALETYRLRSGLASTGGAQAQTAGDTTVIGPMQYLRKHTPPDAKVLALRPADMFYAGRSMISYLDPRMIAFYSQTDSDQAFAVLKSLGIDYLQLPDYALPPLYNSRLMNIAADRRYVELLYDENGYQIYRLRDAIDPSADRDDGLSVPIERWQQLDQWMLGGSGSIGSWTLAAREYRLGESVSAWNRSLLLRRVTTTTLLSEGVDARTGRCPAQRPSRSYSIALEVSGDGFMNVFVQEVGAQGMVRNKSIGGIPLADGPLSFVRRVGVTSEVTAVRVAIVLRPQARVKLLSAQLREACSRARD